eukprot:scaffold12829_cov116-Isochrysis_galbana.AAC.16
MKPPPPGTSPTSATATPAHLKATKPKRLSPPTDDRPADVLTTDGIDAQAQRKLRTAHCARPAGRATAS